MLTFLFIMQSISYNNSGEKMSKSIKIITFLILLFVLVYLSFLVWPRINTIISYVFRIILPFLISFSIAYVFNPFVCYLEKYLKKRGYAVTITLVLLFTFLYIFISYLVPFIMKESKDFFNNYDIITSSIEKRINEFCERFSFLPTDYQPSFDNIKAIIRTYVEKAQLGPELIINKLLDYISVIVIIPMTLLYFLLDFEKIKLRIKKRIKNNRLLDYLTDLDYSFTKFIRTSLIIMIMLIFLSTACFLIVKLDYPLLFGLIIGITNIIPYIGPYLGGILPVCYALIDSDSKALVILIIIIFIQVLESEIISPYLHSKDNNLHPILVIFGLVFFGKLLGIMGMILSIPLMSMIRITHKYYPIKFILKNDK